MSEISETTVGQALLKAASTIISKNPKFVEKFLGPDVDVLSMPHDSLERSGERAVRRECKKPLCCSKFLDGECDCVPSSLCLE